MDDEITWIDGVKWAEKNVKSGQMDKVRKVPSNDSHPHAFTEGVKAYLEFHKYNPDATLLY